MIEESINLIIPELIILAGACVALFADVGKSRLLVYITAQLTVLIALLVMLGDFQFVAPVTAFNDFFVLDNVARVAKIGLCVFTLFVFLYTRSYTRNKSLPAGEYYALCLFALLGMMIIASSAHMLTLYLSIELLALSLYPMIALHRDDSRSAEAAMKYFVLGAVASGIMLYGISLLYGLTGSLYFADMAAGLQGSAGDGQIVFVAALIFIIVGVAFKFGAVPFHMWLPDVYQGAPYGVATFIASVTKLSSFMMAYRLLFDAFDVMGLQWQPLIAILAVISVVFGNLVAIMQSNIRRMLAYSAIAHAGFILLGFVPGTETGFAASLFYTLTYVLMGLGIFGILTIMSSQDHEISAIDDLRGLGRRSPWIAFLLMILLFSMAGIPLTVGFYAKFAILQGLLEVGQLWLAVVAVIATVVGAYYYLRVIKVMYFDHYEQAQSEAWPVSPMVTMTLSLNCFAVIALFLFPQPLMQICTQVFQ